VRQFLRTLWNKLWLWDNAGKGYESWSWQRRSGAINMFVSQQKQPFLRNSKAVNEPPEATTLFHGLQHT